MPTRPAIPSFSAGLSRGCVGSSSSLARVVSSAATPTRPSITLPTSRKRLESDSEPIAVSAIAIDTPTPVAVIAVSVARCRYTQNNAVTKTGLGARRATKSK